MSATASPAGGLDRRSLLLLAFAQALGSAGVSMIVLVGGIVGSRLAPSPAWSTLPVAAMVVGLAASSAPAALLMKRIGRRPGFLLGAALAALASCLGAWAMARGSFALLCAATALIGANGAFVSQYRFAAAESADAARTAKAVSLVLAGGVLAGLLGPALGRIGKDWFGAAPFAGSFLLAAGLYAAAGLLLSLLRGTLAQRPAGRAGPASAETESAAGEPAAGRPLGVILRQPQALAALLAGIVSYAVMTFTMTAAPVSMNVLDHHSLNQAGFVIQSHIVAMYAPSFFTGFLMARLGLVPSMLLGVFLLAGSAGVSLLGSRLFVYWAALVLLGLGWNFLFVGATTLLTRTYRPEERFQVQGVNDFLVFGFQAASSLLSGAALFRLGWRTLNLLNLPLLALVLAFLLTVSAQQRAKRKASAPAVALSRGSPARRSRPR
jgi:MFS family permease